MCGADFRLEIQSSAGEGTLIRMAIPEVVFPMQTVGTQAERRELL